MRKTWITGIVPALFCVLAVGATAQEPPKPQKEHEWLQQLVGEWETEGEIVTEPGQPPLKTKGSESGRKIGGFWVLMETKGQAGGISFTGILTLGYDPNKKKYLGTWIDSVTNHLWRYEGSVDAAGKMLTLDTEGPGDEPGKLSKFRETIEVKGADQKAYTSSIEKDGKWVTFLTIKYQRKK